MRSYDRARWTVNRIQRTSVTICNVDTMRTSIDYSVQISFVQHEDLHTYRVSMRKYPITESGSRLELRVKDGEPTEGPVRELTDREKWPKEVVPTEGSLFQRLNGFRSTTESPFLQSTKVTLNRD